MRGKRAKMLRKVAKQYNKANPESIYKLLKDRYRRFIHDGERTEKAKALFTR